jgi:hypothetical protein
VSGALTERDFVRKLEKAGFTDVDIVERTPLSVADCGLYPLFTEDLLALMRTLLPRDQHDRVATAIVLRARLA